MYHFNMKKQQMELFKERKEVKAKKKSSRKEWDRKESSFILGIKEDDSADIKPE
jgi:hypothetical protein